MPIPQPEDNESNTQFMDRCMHDQVMMEDYPDSQQRLAVCLGQLKMVDRSERSIPKDRGR